MKFKSVELQALTVYSEVETHETYYNTRMVQTGEIVDVHFDEVIESFFHADVAAGLYIPFDQRAIDWTCKHMEVSAC